MSDRTVTVEGHEIELTNLDKVLFPESGETKADLIDHYDRIAPHALHHYRDRPLSMHRFPDGIGKDGFFQKDTPEYFPDWIERATLDKENGAIDYVVANGRATLVYLANQGCITTHLGLSRVDRPHHPDRMIFDLDPPGDDFAKVRDAAKRLKAVLDELELASFVQTTGSRGLHVIVPLDRSEPFDDVRAFSRRIADHLAEQNPDRLTVEHRKAKRGDRLFLDTLRNAYGQTAVGAYAVRAREGAPVATPLRWDEVGAGDLDARTYRMSNIFRRLAQIEDPWADIDRHAQALEPARKKLDALS